MPGKPPRQLLSLSLAIVASAGLFLTLLYSSQDPFVQAQTGETPTAEASPEVEEELGVQDLPTIESKLNTPIYPNIDSNLNDIVQQYESGQSTAQVAAANAPIHSDESVAVTIYITEGYADDITDYLNANGASPRNIGADYIEAYVPVSLLPEASTQEGVISISTIIPPQPAQGAVVSEGVAVHGATAWHDAGFKGQGVRIGIIDNGFQGFRTLMGVEVPSDVEARCYTSIGAHTFNLSDCDNADESSHGTAVTEAVFDIAPEATYYIASPISGGDLLASVEWMIEHEVDVINMSLSWSWSGPGDGTSRFSESSLKSVDAAVEAGIIWVNSAGNEADNTWYGPFRDADGDDFHEFRGIDECNDFEVELEAGESLIAMLRWDDSWTAPSSDLDLHLLIIDEGQARIVSSAVTDQNETLRPFEWIRGAPTNGGEFCLAVSHERGSIPPWIQLQAFTGQDLEYSVSERTIVEPADSDNPGLLAVGAAPWSDTFTLERFSSRGPTHDGRIKPDVVGADRGKSAIRRSADNPDGRWGGTSQSSAHVAGIAALVRQQFPEYTPEQVATYLKNHAEARGAVPNNFWGYGFARLLASDAAVPEPTPTPDPTASPSPTMTPEPSPTPPSESCIEAVGGGAIPGEWAAECQSSHPDRSGHYARFYTLSLSEASEVTITLESTTDPYLYLREGTGVDGTVLCENDDYGLAVTGTLCDQIDSSLDWERNSGMVASLPKGAFTIEATTFDKGAPGNFTLTIRIGDGSTQPTPSPTPGPSPIPTSVPLPSDYNIEDYACYEDDISHLGSFERLEDVGPNSLDDPGYSGIIVSYETRWSNLPENALITCAAVQFDSIGNARWTELDYAKHLQRVGHAINIRSHELAFIPWIGDDMLAYQMHYHSNDSFHSSATVTFLDASTIIASRVIYFAFNSDEYPDITKPESIALNIAARIFEPGHATPAVQGTASLHSLLEAYGLLERVLD